MGIAFGSINTGLPKDIVQQLMNAERIPVKTMEEKKAKIAEKKGLVQELTQLTEAMRGSLMQNASERSLREFKLNFREDIINATADKNLVEPGSYQFEVTQLARKSSAMTSGFESPDDSYIGVGFIQFTMPDGENREIYVDSDNASLNGVAKLINADVKNGVRANVIDDGSGSDSPFRLILSLEDTGDMAKADFPYFYFVDGINDFFVEFEREAQDAKVKLDGFEIELPANTTSDLIPGVTIDLLKASIGEEFTINIDEDSKVIAEKIKTIIDQINAVLKFITDQNTLDEKTDTSRTLGGDSLLQSLEGRIRSTIFMPIETKFGMKRIGDLGVTFQRNGQLAFDEKIFEKKLNENYKLASQILVGHFPEDGQKTSGFLDNLRETANTALRVPDGLLQSRGKTLQSNIERIDRRIVQKERMLQQKESNLKDKFARLEGTISRIKSQSAGLAGLSTPQDPTTQLG